MNMSQLLTLDTQQLVNDSFDNKENTAPGRFWRPLTDNDIRTKQKNVVPANTSRSNNFALGVWQDWAEHRNLQPETRHECSYPIPVDISNFVSYQDMDFWLQRFICEIRRKNGQPNPPQTLQNIASGLQRYLHVEKSAKVNFFDSHDSTFAGFRKTIDSRMRELTNEGVGVEQKRSDPMSKEDERTMWEKGVFSMDTSKGLSNAVFFYNEEVSKTLEPVLPEEFKKPKIEPIPEPEEPAKSSGFQSESPLIHTLHSRMFELTRDFLGMFLKPENITQHPSQHVELDITDKSLGDYAFVGSPVLLGTLQSLSRLTHHAGKRSMGKEAEDKGAFGGSKPGQQPKKQFNQSMR
ncbi:hypothetical protein MAR_024783 [Mya arenaria]|uniref:QRICH1-like domain-containing protein n=1 Tax=Mya arenaria TaxID=6604 RepID=A0ABY7DUR1_MYAAR|nr:hypothetical protein MAR_024783 [Mya arenaria]